MSFGPPMFTPEMIHETFFGEVAQEYMRNSDAAMGSGIIKEYMNQLAAIGQMRTKNQSISIQNAVLAALNIKWLLTRGLMPNDDFNGIQYIHAKTY